MVERRGPSTGRATAEFAVAALLTLAGGVALERLSQSISTRVGISGVLFGATVLAAATALPELSTGLQSLRMGDYQLAFSDIFGGNAFLPVLFLPAAIISGSAVLPQAHDTDVYLTALAILLRSSTCGGCSSGRSVSGVGSDLTRSRSSRSTHSASSA
jgi:cation:H+ antiporter